MFDWFKAYDSLDEIDEDKRGAFVESDGKYVIEKRLDPSGLKSTLEKFKKEAAEAKAFKRKFANYDDDQLETLADDLDELADLRAAKEAGEIGGKDSGNIDELVEKRVAAQTKKFERERLKLESQLKEYEEGLNGARGKVRELTLGAETRKHASKAGVKDHAMDDALYQVFKHFDVNEDGEIVDTTDAGRSLDDFFSEMIPVKPGWTFDPKTAGTGNAGGRSPSGVARVTREQLAKMNPKEAAAAMAKVNAGELQFGEE